VQLNPRRSARLRAPLSILLATGALTFLAAAPAGAQQPASTPLPGAVPTAGVTIPAGATVPSLAKTAINELGIYAMTGLPESMAAYTNTRAQIATLVGFELGLDPALFDRAWASTDLVHQTALMGALSQVGVPYRKMAKPEVGFDCSGLTSYAWSVAGRTIPRSSGTQIKAAVRVNAQTAVAGDLVYYPGHVSMYLGVPGTMVHSPYPGRNVEVDFISERRINTVLYGNPVV
jgi:cell wall-associated NlpC family hydrolase